MAHILVVDDEKDIRDTLGRILSKAGYEVRLASGAMEAWALVENYKPDLFLLDIKMPEVNGLELCRRIRANPGLRGIPIIMVTAYADEKEEALKAGADDFLVKPLDMWDILSRTKCILRIGQLTNELERTKAYLEELRKAGKI